MRTVSTELIKNTVSQLCAVANWELTPDMKQGLDQAVESEESPLGRSVLAQLVENAKLAQEKQVALCQDTGMVVVFLEIGQEVCLTGEYLEESINEGVRQAYKQHYFRHSVVDDPFIRNNTKDNSPAVIHTRIVPGNRVKIEVAPKGFGSENMSSLKMLKPAAGIEGVKEFVMQTILAAGGNPCPPITVGVGVGGTMEKAAILAKKALLHPLTYTNPAEHLAQIERELLASINKSGIGPQGYGGRVTALAVHLEVYPTHIAGLPVAVNINCHIARHRQATL